MKQFRVFTSFEKEENYLNRMGKQGWNFVRRTALRLYSFEKNNTFDQKYRIDYRIFDNKKKFVEYKEMFHDFGWHHLSGGAYSGKQYFVSSDVSGSSELFSTNESAASRYKRLVQVQIINILLMIFYIFTILECYMYNGSNFHISDIHLWAWLPILLFIIVGIYSGIQFIITRQRYKNSMNV